MTLKLKPREKLLAAHIIGNIKLAVTSEEYTEAVDYLIEADTALLQLRQALSGMLPVAVVTGGMDGKGNVVGIGLTSTGQPITAAMVEIFDDQPTKPTADRLASVPKPKP